MATKKPTNANSKQVGGQHYKTKSIQPWDYIADNGIGYFDGCAIKYISRYKEKGGVNDLRKAIHYIEKLIEIEEKKRKTEDECFKRLLVALKETIDKA